MQKRLKIIFQKKTGGYERGVYIYFRILYIHN